MKNIQISAFRFAGKRFSIILFSYFILFLQNPIYCQNTRGKTNIINYFANNNQVIGSPMIEEENEFRFYPDFALKNAVIGAQVWYYVKNDMFMSETINRENGMYWSAKLRPFWLGESIQRVEVVVQYRKGFLDTVLSRYGIDTSKFDLANYLILKRGDDRALLAKRLLNSVESTCTTQKSPDSTSNPINTSVLRVKLNTPFYSVGSQNNEFLEIRRKIDTLKELNSSKSSNPYLCFPCDSQKKEKVAEKNKKRQEINSKEKLLIDSIYTLTRTIETAPSSNNVQTFEMTDNRTLGNSLHQNNLPTLVGTLSGSIQENEKKQAIQGMKSDIAELYSSYVENWRGSILDIRLDTLRQNNSTTAIIEMVYRNDKRALQYLQAEDPKEHLSIVRVRYVPFPVYFQEQNLNWQSSRPVFEIAFNFGYAVLKDDDFTPVLFDVNRLGLGIAFSSDLFSPNAKFIALGFTYDINTYTSMSFGANIQNIDRPFYVGIGINSHAFKDIVKGIAGLFGRN